MALLTAEVTWLRCFRSLVFLSLHLLLSDITCALSIVSDSVKNELTKHIDASFVHVVVQDSGYCSSICAFRVTVGGFPDIYR